MENADIFGGFWIIHINWETGEETLQLNCSTQNYIHLIFIWVEIYF